MTGEGQAGAALPLLLPLQLVLRYLQESPQVKKQRLGVTTLLLRGWLAAATVFPLVLAMAEAGSAVSFLLRPRVCSSHPSIGTVST